jgi:hypothetical protein
VADMLFIKKGLILHTANYDYSVMESFGNKSDAELKKYTGLSQKHISSLNCTCRMVMTTLKAGTISNDAIILKTRDVALYVIYTLQVCLYIDQDYDKGIYDPLQLYTEKCMEAITV